MKKSMVAIVALLAFNGSIALADLILPTQAVISGADAKTVNAKIIEVTSAVPQEFMGRKSVSAKAEVSCSEFSDGQVSCKIDIKK